MIDPAVLEKIRAANRLEDVLASYGAKILLHGRGRKRCLCVFHSEKNPSLVLNEKTQTYKCFGCDESGDVFKLVMKLDGLDFPHAVEKLAKRAGIPLHGDNGSQAKTATRSKTTTEPMPQAEMSAEWQECVEAFSEEQVAKLAEWRGYSVDFVRWLREQELVGSYQGKVAFPVHDEARRVVGIHYRIPPMREGERADWYYTKGCKVRPFILGDPEQAAFVLAFESQWDLLAVAERLNWHTQPDAALAFVSTRGASNGKLVAGLVHSGAVILAFAQNDTAGGKWLQDVADNAGVPVKHVCTPRPHKDSNDWTRAGAVVADLQRAMSEAQSVSPGTVEQSKDDKAPAQLEKAIVTSTELQGMALEPREFVLRPFFKAGDLGFVYAPRGDGKTWLSLLAAKAAASGTAAGPWQADKPWTVLYVDGEMPAEESKRRLVALGGAGENFLWLHHEIYFERTGKTLNLASLPTQQELTELCRARGVRVLILDNLSCLFCGLKENDADSWEIVLPWLLELRRWKISVVIVAHAGRSGQHIRGTSRREDQAFWVLRLERSETDDPLFRGLTFRSVFTKNRNALEDEAPPLEWTITSDADGKATVTAKTISGVDLLVSWVRAGLESAKDIAEEMKVSKGYVSKLAKRAERIGEIVIEGGRYKPTNKGGNV